MRRATLLSFILLAAVAVFLYWHFPSVGGNLSDTYRYKEIGAGVQRVIRGVDAEVASEYPPFMSAVFYLVYIGSLLGSYSLAWVVFVFLFLALVVLYAVWRLTEADRWLFSLSVLGTAFLLYPMLVFTRYDLVVAALLFLVWRAYERQHYRDSAVFLMLASLVKIVPVIVLPILFICTPRRQRRQVVQGAILGLVVGVLFTVMVMGIDATARNYLYMARYHESRGIMAESTWSGLNMLYDNLRGQKSIMGFHHRAVHNEDASAWAGGAARFSLLLGVAVIYSLAWMRRGLDRPRAFILYVFMLLYWILAVSPLFSPQFLVWVVPLSIVWLIERISAAEVVRVRIVLIVALVVAVGLATQWIWPFHYAQVIAQDRLLYTLILNVRNASLFLLAWLFYKEIRVVLRTALSSS